MISLKKVYLLLFLLTSLSTYALAQCNNPDDYAALYALYNSTDGANWSNNFNWDVSATPPATPPGLDMSTWHGITCNGGRVTKVEVYQNSLTGNIPTEIEKLSNLQVINFNFNNLTGNIPIEIENLLNLEILSFAGNELTGSIPLEIGNLTNLTEVILSSNQFTGNIPASLSNLVNLTYLQIGDNKLTGNIPSFLGNLINLTRLNISINKFTGGIPSSLGNLVNLTHLEMWNNELTGNIPASLGNLSSLEFLRLHYNQISSISTSIGNLSSLKEFSINNNQLTSLPASIGNLTSLEIFYLSGNQLTSLPSSIGNLSNLNYLSLQDNQLTTLPASIGNLINLNELLLSTNQMLSLPSELGNLTNLTQLSASNNLLTDLPSSIGNLSNLRELWLISNSFTGNIPAVIFNLSSLENLSLDYNQLTGISPLIGNLSNLKDLSLTNNQFSGNIPEEIGSLTNLRRLQLSTNQLTGSIPVSFNQLLQLTSLLLYDNDLSGCYDPALKDGASVLCNFTNANISAGNTFDADWEDFCNNDAGKCVCDNPDDYAALYALYNSTDGANWTFSNNWDVSAIPPAVPVGLDMSNWQGISCKQGRITKVQLITNNLTGTIPLEMQKLTELTDLDLAVNNLTGSIPEELGNLPNLVHIDLAVNQLTGSIPNSFNQLSGLNYLVLSNNQLSGCYDAALKMPPSVLCDFTDTDISAGNTFDADWEDFCNFDSGNCCGTNIWNGNVDNNWETPGNWNKGYIPLDCQNVIISGVGEVINVNSATAQAASISIVNGNTLNVKAGAILTIDGDQNSLSTDGINISGNGAVINNLGSIICMNSKRRGLNINTEGLFNNNGALQVSNYNIYIQAYHGIEVYEMGQMTNTGSITINSSVSNFDTDGISCKSGASITNSGSITIANIQGSNSEGITNEATFSNENTATITINTVGNSFGLLNSTVGAYFSNNGSLFINNTFSDGVSNTNLAVFGGSGSVSMNTFENIAELSPGNSPGAITLNGNLHTTQDYIVEIDSKAGIGIGHDHLQVNGDIDLSGTMRITNNTPGGTLLNEDKFVVLSYTGTRTGTFTDAKMDLFPAGWTVTYDASFCGKCIVVHGPAAVLPVEWTSFTARKQDDAVELNWTVAAEINNKGFQIQHSTDGQVWGEMGWVAGLGTSTVAHRYQFTHETPVKGYNYYRLKQLDFDGQTEYSKVLSVNFEAEDKVTFYPNPAKDELFIVGKNLGNATISIFNATGQNINVQLLNKDVNEMSLDVSLLENGLYLIHIQLANRLVFSKQVMKH